MNKTNIALAKKTLTLLEKKAWKNISLSNILNDKKESNLKNKIQILENINRYFDFLLKENLSNLENSSKKDMLFEIFMARLDILNIHRTSIKKLINHFFYNPQDFIRLLPSFIETIILICTLSNIELNGIKAAPKIKLIFILYLLIIYTWYKDETVSLDKSMTALDKYLNNINKFIKLD